MSNDAALAALRAEIDALEAQARSASSSADALGEEDGSPESLARSFKLLDAADSAAKQLDGRLDGLLSGIDEQLRALEAQQPKPSNGKDTSA